jgi:hypothetical protein
MASQLAATGARPYRSEEGDALYRVVMAVTAASGGMIATFAVAQGGVPLSAAPTLVLLIALLRRSPRVAAWSGVALWALVLPMASGIGILAPAAMAVVCLAFAIGPDRLLDWVRDEWTGREDDAVALPAGWIEDDR